MVLSVNPTMNLKHLQLWDAPNLSRFALSLQALLPWENTLGRVISLN
jgi:hypothetical protein